MMEERHESDTQTESCRQCGDTGWMIEADRGSRRAQRCECWAVRHAAARFEAAGIPERYANCSFENFTVYDNDYLEAAGPDRQPPAVAAARDVPLVRAVRPGLPHARAQPASEVIEDAARRMGLYKE